ATVSGTSTDIISGDTVTFTPTTATFNNKNVGTNKAVSITGVQLGGTDGNNYAITSTTGSATANITAKSLTAAFTTTTKEYDGTTAATVVGNSTQIAGTDVVTIASTSASFSDKNAGTGKTVSVAGISIAGTDAGNYSLANTTATTTGNITTKALSISGITAANKTYDGTTSATVSTASAVKTGLLTNDVVNVSATGVFDNKNVGTNKIVTLTSSYSGSDAGNYNITNQAQTSANVTPRILAVTATANDKTYDTTRTATYSLSSDQVAGDVLTLAASTALFDTKNAAAGKTVTVGGISVTGADASNYTLQNLSTTTTAEIRKANLAITGLTATNKIYDGNTTATLTGTAAVAALQGDTVSLSGSAAATFDSKNVGTGKAITTGYTLTGTDAGNYNLITPSLTADITPKALTISGITAANKVYDRTTAATVSTANVATTGLVSGDSFTVTATGAFQSTANTQDGKNVGTGKTVQLTSTYGGTDKNNYTITGQATATADITAKAMTISGITAANKVYDGTANATLNTTGMAITGLITGDTVTVNTAGAFRNANNTANDKNVGTGKTVQITSTYGGADVNNYAITGQASTTADITAKAMTVSGITAANKVYDGTTAASINTANVVTNGLVSGDNFAVAASGVFQSTANTQDGRNVGTGKTVVLTPTYTGNDVGNYTITGQTTTTADITPKAMTISGITAANKVYDGTATATVSTSGVVTTGLVSGDSFTVSASGTFRNADNTANDKNAGNAKTVQLASSYGGSDVGNYTITGQATTTADIAKKDVAFTRIYADNKTYNASAAANITTDTVTGTVGSETLLIGGSGTFESSNPSVNKTVTVANVADLTKKDGSGNWSNYNLTNTGPMTTTASILPASNVSPPPAELAQLSNEAPTSVLPSVQSAAQLVKATNPVVVIPTASAVTPQPVLLTQAISSAASVAKNLSPTQVAELPPAQLGPLIKSLDRSQLLAITEKQMSGLNVNQLDDLIGLLNRVAYPAKP
ncbi:MAG: beta strand repeat-containing protein, partial [Limnohabitans sp.]